MKTDFRPFLSELEKCGLSTEEAKSLVSCMAKVNMFSKMDIDSQIVVQRELSLYKSELNLMRVNTERALEVFMAASMNPLWSSMKAVDSRVSYDRVKQEALRDQDTLDRYNELSDRILLLQKWSDVVSDTFWIVKGAFQKT